MPTILLAILLAVVDQIKSNARLSGEWRGGRWQISIQVDVTRASREDVEVVGAAEEAGNGL